MLVLSRKGQEWFAIGGNIKITVIEIHRGSVKIGIDAPRQIPVLRGELIDQGIDIYHPDERRE